MDVLTPADLAQMRPVEQERPIEESGKLFLILTYAIAFDRYVSVGLFLFLIYYWCFENVGDSNGYWFASRIRSAHFALYYSNGY